MGLGARCSKHLLLKKKADGDQCQTSFVQTTERWAICFGALYGQRDDADDNGDGYDDNDDYDDDNDDDYADDDDDADDGSRTTNVKVSQL